MTPFGEFDGRMHDAISTHHDDRAVAELLLVTMQVNNVLHTDI